MLGKITMCHHDRANCPPAGSKPTCGRRVGAGESASGDALPSIAALAESYGTSRATVAKAMRRLADDGLVEIVPQWGTFRT